MFGKKTSFYAIIAGVTLLIIIGLVYTEILQKNYQDQITERRLTHQQLEKQAPAIINAAIQKTLNSQDLSIEDIENIDFLGCSYTNTYTGRKNSTDEFAQNKIIFENNAPIKEICPSEETTLNQLTDYQVFWTGNQVYTKESSAADFIPADPDNTGLLDKPSVYLSKYFKAYQTLPDKIDLTQTDNTINASYKIKDNDTETTLNLEIILPDTLTKFTYIQKKEGILSTNQGKVTLNYHRQDPRPQTFNTGTLSNEWLQSRLDSLNDLIYISQGSNIFTINGKLKELSIILFQKGQSDYQNECKLQNQDCFNRHKASITKLKQYFSAFNTTPALGECDNLRLPASVNYDQDIITVTIIPTDRNESALKIETLIQSGKTYITKTLTSTGPNDACFETTIPVAYPKSLLSDIKYILEQ